MTIRRPCILAVCFLECIFFGGTIFGWAPLNYIFLRDGIFYHICDHATPGNVSYSAQLPNMTQDVVYVHAQDDGNGSVIGQRAAVAGGDGPEGHSEVQCSRQSRLVSLAFIVGMVSMGLTALPLGRIFDRWGLRVVRTGGCVCAILGYALLAFARRGVLSWLIFPGCSLVSVSCYVIIMTNSYVAQLAAGRASTVMALYSGAVSTSAVIFLIVKVLHGHGIPRCYSLGAIAGAWSLVLVSTFCLLPKFKISLNADSQTVQNEKETELHEMVPTEAAVQPERPASQSPMLEQSPATPPTTTARRHIFTPLYVMHIFWFSINHIRLSMFIASFNKWATHILGGNIAQVSHVTNVYSIAQCFGVVVSPIAGLLIDRGRIYLNKHDISGPARAIATVPSVTLVSMTAILVSGLVLSPKQTMIYPAVIVSEIYRSFLYPVTIGLLQMAFPGEHFGTLLGVAYAVTGLAAFMTYPYVLWADIGGFLPVNIFLLCTVIVSVVHPSYILIRHKGMGENVDNTDRSTAHA